MNSLTLPKLGHQKTKKSGGGWLVLSDQLNCNPKTHFKEEKLNKLQKLKEEEIDNDGFCEVHVNTIEGFWSLLRSLNKTLKHNMSQIYL